MIPGRQSEASTGKHQTASPAGGARQPESGHNKVGWVAPTCPEPGLRYRETSPSTTLRRFDNEAALPEKIRADREPHRDHERD